MLFLMAIGVSTMAAATANSGFLIRQNDYSRIRILDESIHENIMFSLRAAPDNDVDRPDFLGYHIALAIYGANDGDYPGYSATGLGDSELELLISGTNIDTMGGLVTVESIMLRFQSADEQRQGIRIRDPIPPVTVIGDPNPIVPGEPKTATMSARLIVEVEISARGWGGNATSRTVTSRAVYDFTGGRLTAKDTPAFPGEMEFDVGGFGQWELVSYEVIDT